MPTIIMIGEGGSINPERVLMIASMKSAPVKRLLKYADPDKVINMTYGYPQRSLIIFDTGFMAITHHEIYTLSQAVRRGKEVDYDDTLPF